MNLLKTSLFILGMQLLVCTGYSQEKVTSTKSDTLKLSISQAQQFALENNQSILNANLDIEAAKKKVWETTTIGLPQVNGKMAFSYTPELPASIEQFSSLGLLGIWMYNADQALNQLQPNNGAFGQIVDPGPPVETNPNDLKWSLNGTLTVSQLLFSGSYLVGLQSAKVYKSLSELNQVKSKQDILESISNSYMNLLIARENRMIMDSTYSNLVKTFTDIQAIAKEGFVEETDVDQMQITVSSVKSSLDFIIRMEDVAEKVLKLQLGINLNAPIVLTDTLKSLIDALTYEQLLIAEFVLENNINYKQIEINVKASELMLKLRKSESLPDLAAFYQYQKEFNDQAFTFTPPHVIGVSMNVPIFSSGGRSARVAQAKIDLLKAKNTRDQVANSLWLDYYSTKSALISAHDKYNTERKNLELARKIYNRGLIKYTNGVISSTELTQIQNQYLTSQSNYYTSLQELISSRNKLEKLLTKANN